MIKDFLKRLATINRLLWGKKALNYHRLSRINLQNTPERARKKPAANRAFSLGQRNSRQK
ncbi:MAG TPA: hypothetical protein GXZ98_05720 [Firmicutes bacterium]|jgi:hypothetical protein|nr:hypothetical protein [Bacillota bacterium]